MRKCYKSVSDFSLCIPLSTFGFNFNDILKCFSWTPLELVCWSPELPLIPEAQSARGDFPWLLARSEKSFPCYRNNFVTKWIYLAVFSTVFCYPVLILCKCFSSRGPLVYVLRGAGRSARHLGARCKTPWSVNGIWVEAAKDISYTGASISCLRCWFLKCFTFATNDRSHWDLGVLRNSPML